MSAATPEKTVNGALTLPLRSRKKTAEAMMAAGGLTRATTVNLEGE